MQFLAKLGPQAIAHIDLFTQLSSNKFCSTVTHTVHSKTCSVSPHVEAKNGSQESVVRLIRNAFFASCSSSSSAHISVELDTIFASGKHQESRFICAWQDEFPFFQVCEN